MRLRLWFLSCALCWFIPLTAVAHSDSTWVAAFGNEKQRMKAFSDARNALRENLGVKFKDNRHYVVALDAAFPDRKAAECLSRR
jgi:hypothetical protein